VQPQSAPPDCGFSTSATPKAFEAISPAGISEYNYKSVMISQGKFLIIFKPGGVFGSDLFQRKKCRGIAKKYGDPG
jgi:hypothetical protein